MHIHILNFGILKDIFGAREIQFPLPNTPLTVGGLRQQLMAQQPALQQLVSMAIAVNGAYAHDETPLRAGDEVALIPPVSGG